MTPATDKAVAEVRRYLGMPESELPTSAILEVLERCQWNVKQTVGRIILEMATNTGQLSGHFTRLSL